MTTVIEFMADLDRQISDQIATLQAQGADRGEIETRYRELNTWALQQCVEQQGKQSFAPASPAPSDPSSTPEEYTLQRLWNRAHGDMSQAFASGQITAVHYFALVRCEDGCSVAFYADSDDDENCFVFFAAENFWSHFNPSLWEPLLADIAVSFGAEIEVIDLYQRRIFDEEIERQTGWRRVA